MTYERWRWLLFKLSVGVTVSACLFVVSFVTSVVVRFVLGRWLPDGPMAFVPADIRPGAVFVFIIGGLALQAAWPRRER